MTEFVIVDGGVPTPLNFRQLRGMFPNVSFPADPGPEALSMVGAELTTTEVMPDTGDLETATLSELPSLIGGVWTYTWDVTPLPQAQQNEMVDQERDRRIFLGQVFSLEGYAQTLHLSGDPQTTANLQARATMASNLIQSGVTDPVFGWRDEDNIVHNLTPAQLLELFNKASMFVDSVYHASWTLKDNPAGIPVDFKDDAHWPSQAIASP